MRGNLKKITGISILLNHFDAPTFLAHYWQKKPLLIQQAYLNFQNPISADELAGLSCEPEAEARIILEKDGRSPWELRHGPFRKKDFKDLPNSHWTLLVQATNHWVPELQTLLDDFRFIPQWRIEDIMTSFAAPKGSVGPHVDNYDVFLLQAEGQREWQIGLTPLVQDDFLPEHEVKILKQFKADEKYLLNPGDILYLPPRFAHYGIAVNNCITHSIGFRAPTYQEILDDYFNHVISLIAPNLRYADPDLTLSKNPGEIDKATLKRITRIIRHNATLSDQQIKHWFGQFITQNKYINDQKKPIAPISEKELTNRIEQGNLPQKNPSARFAFYQRSKSNLFLC